MLSRRVLPICILLALGALTGCVGTANKQERVTAESIACVACEKRTPAQLNELYADYFEESLRRSPMRATQIGDPRFNDQLPDAQSESYRREDARLARQWQKTITAIDASDLAPKDRLSYDIFKYNIDRAVRALDYPGWQMPINQFRLFPAQLAIMGSGQGAQPFKTVADYDNWRKRAANVPRNIATTIANMKTGMANGNVQPKVLMQKVLPQLDALIKDRAEDTVFWKPIEKLPAEISSADQARLKRDYQQMIEQDLMPAYRSLRQFINDEYLPACRDTVAWSALPNGQAWYAEMVSNQTTTELTPEQIHRIGVAEVERIQGEMRALAKTQGIAIDPKKGDLKSIFDHYQNDPKFVFKTEADLLAAYNGYRQRVENGVPKLFRLVPKAPFEIRPVEAFRAASAAGGQYNGPSQDGTRPGIFYVNTYDLPTRKTWDMESLYLHEAVPGHHFQIALQQELTDLPMFRRFGGETAFSEGWGLYAESLGKELGVYTDVDQYFGRLQAELWRAIRLVVDTGLHSKGWTREQVIQYMLDNSATSLTEATSEAERYIAIPGQALAYKIGELRILMLRKRAETKLGSLFDPREFHAEVLQDGAVPLSVLESKIDRWIGGVLNGKDAAASGGGN
jgi:uncharacterized protein (DUF885 family)